MATTYLKIDKYSVAFGVSIKSSDLEKPKSSDAKKFAKQAKGAYSLAQSFESGVKLFSAPMGRKIEKAVVPGIAAFARLTEEHVSENHAWIIRLPDNQVCLQILEKRTPYSDEIVNVSDIGVAITNKYSELQLSEGFTVHITPDFDESFKAQFAGFHDLAVNDLLHAKALDSLRMQPVKDYNLTIVLALTTVVAFSFMGYDYFKSKKAAEKEVNIQTFVPVDQGKEYDANVTQQLSLAGYKGIDAVAVMEKVFHSSETSAGGWVMNTITCTQTQCSELWEKINGTHNTLKATFSDKLAFDSNQKTATHTQIIAGVASPILRESITDFSTLESLMLDKVEVINAISKVTLTFGPSKLFGLTKDQKAEQIPAEKQIRQGTFEIAGPVGIFFDITKQLPANVAVRTVIIEKLQSDADSTFVLKGDYFVK